MLVFPNCKINLGLNILSKRKDGFHNLETIFYPIPLTDGLEILASDGSTKLHLTGYSIDGEITQNLCYKAYEIVKADFPSLPSINIHLHKAIPMGAGLGGGSADGAFMIKMLNDKFGLRLPIEKLLDYSLRLGSDCPFFIVNAPAFASGRGEFLEPISIDLSMYKIVVVYPHIHINTGWAFGALSINEKNTERPSLKEVVRLPVEKWKASLTNDFELPVFDKYPEIKNIKDQLYSAGALFASMSGTGSTVYGIFHHNDKPSINFPSSYFIKELVGKS